MQDTPHYRRRRAGFVIAALVMMAAMPEHRRPLIGTLSIGFDHSLPQVEVRLARQWQGAAALIFAMMRS